MNAVTTEAGAAGGSPAAERSQRRAQWTILTWALSLAAATLILASDANLPGPARWTLALVPSLIGVAMLVAYVAFLRDADELQRKIQVEALALGFGAGLVAMHGYRLLERAGMARLDVNDLGIVMVVAFVTGIVFGRRRYS